MQVKIIDLAGFSKMTVMLNVPVRAGARNYVCLDIAVPSRSVSTFR
jgi:hypothetical protein